MTQLIQAGKQLLDIALGVQYTSAGKVVLDSSGAEKYLRSGKLLFDTNGFLQYIRSGKLYVGKDTLLTAYSADSTGKITTSFEDARTSDLYVPDHDGVLHAIPGGTVAFDGARAVKNVVTNAVNVAIAPVTYAGTGGGATYITKIDGNTVQFAPATSDSWGQYGSLYWNMDTSYRRAGRRVIARIRISGNGTARIKAEVASGPVKTYYDVTLTSTPIVISVRVDQTLDSPSWGPTFYVERRPANTVSEATIHDVQIEDVDTTVTAPSEYTSDIAFYNTQNGNTVDANGVVTEAVGAPITTPIKMVHAPAATNYADGSNGLSGGPETITLSSTGDYTLSVYGTAAVTVAAGTAAGTGFAQATEGNPVTFNLTATGTVTLTLDSGTLDTIDGAAAKQVENNAFATPFIPTVSSSGASRDRCEITAPYSGNFNQLEGITYIELETNSIDTTGNPKILQLRSLRPATIYFQGALIVGSDGTTYSTKGITLAADTRYHIVLRWKTGDTYEIGYRVRGSTTWNWGIARTYSGTFVNDGLYVRMFRLNPWVVKTHAFEILNKDIGKTAIEDRYSLAKVG